jgi:hypothetical protein
LYQRTGCDREDKSGPGIAPTDEAEMAVTMARTDVAMRMWRLPLVPRETDELPSPTDRKSLWISYFRRKCCDIRLKRHVDDVI